MKLQQKTLDQTGIAILRMEDDSEKQIPLFSCNPVQEAQSLVQNYFPNCKKISSVYFTNNLMETKIEYIISKYREGHACLPEDYMEELLSGFPFIFGKEFENTIAFYA